ncbi:MAG TPA: T9SS type A sorting domain-containing protein [Bacteroidales bacterium]|nr:T9SS type A sorting domain-containing protein [Bacteroidales bacterium]
MKNFIGILFVISSISTFGQFPEPTNFDFSYEYIMVYEWGYCAGQGVYGPTYCSHFTWSAPDTSSTTSTLEYYNLYYYPFLTRDTVILTTTTDLYVDMEIGIIGKIWVTAVYSNPDGESGPSNIIINYDLPISVDENQLQNELNIFYDYKNQEIKIKNGEDIAQINIFNCQGKLIASNTTISDKISIANLPGGFYLIEIIKNNQDSFRHKIIKL